MTPPQMNTMGNAVGKPAAIFMPKKGGRYGPTNHEAAGKSHPLLGTKAVCQLPERKLPAAGWIGGAQLRAAIMQKRYLLPLLSESGPSKGNEIVQTDLNAKSET